MQLSPYLGYKGDCEEAFRFYARCLGGTITGTFPYEGTPMAEQVPAEWRHCRLRPYGTSTVIEHGNAEETV